jgi:hypothetical protein
MRVVSIVVEAVLGVTGVDCAGGSVAVFLACNRTALAMICAPSVVEFQYCNFPYFWAGPKKIAAEKDWPNSLAEILG